MSGQNLEKKQIPPVEGAFTYPSGTTFHSEQVQAIRHGLFSEEFRLP